METPATRFTEHLESLSIPAHGVRGDGPSCLIDFKDEATREQREVARTEAVAFDWTEKHPKSIAELLNAVAALTPEQRQGVLNRMIAEHLLMSPRLAKSLGIEIVKPAT